MIPAEDNRPTDQPSEAGKTITQQGLSWASLMQRVAIAGFVMPIRGSTE
jgi:hypothetical protein